MLIEIDGLTVPHFKAPIYAKLELWGLKYGGTLNIQTGLLKISRLLHKMGFVQTEIATTVLHRAKSLDLCLFYWQWNLNFCKDLWFVQDFQTFYYDFIRFLHQI